MRAIMVKTTAEKARVAMNVAPIWTGLYSKSEVTVLASQKSAKSIK